MAQPKDQLQTVSLTIDDSVRNQKARHTLQPKPRSATDLPPTRPRSQSYAQKSQIILQPPILEGEGEEDETAIGNENSLRTSFTKKPPSRSNSMTGVKAKIVEVRGYDNSAYDEKTGNGVGNREFHRGYIDSTRSSTHESVLSLQVQREQYCCFSRWSPFERRLATSVGILAGVIVALVITVGLMARGEEVDEAFVWKP